MQSIQALLPNAYDVTQTPPYGPVGTFQGFKLDAPLLDRIDHIFVSRQYEVLDYAVLTDSMRGHYPSDHFPVLATAVLE